MVTQDFDKIPRGRRAYVAHAPNLISFTSPPRSTRCVCCKRFVTSYRGRVGAMVSRLISIRHDPSQMLTDCGTAVSLIVPDWVRAVSPKFWEREGTFLLLPRCAQRSAATCTPRSNHSRPQKIPNASTALAAGFVFAYSLV